MNKIEVLADGENVENEPLKKYLFSDFLQTLVAFTSTDKTTGARRVKAFSLVLFILFKENSGSVTMTGSIDPTDGAE